MHRRHVHRCAVRTHCMSSLASTRELCPVHHPPRAAAALCTCRCAALMPRRRAHAAAPPPRPPPPCRDARTRAHPLALSRGRAPARADQCGARYVCAGRGQTPDARASMTCLVCASSDERVHKPHQPLTNFDKDAVRHHSLTPLHEHATNAKMPTPRGTHFVSTGAGARNEAAFVGIKQHYEFETRQTTAFVYALRGERLFIMGGAGVGKSHTAERARRGRVMSQRRWASGRRGWSRRRGPRGRGWTRSAC